MSLLNIIGSHENNLQGDTYLHTLLKTEEKNPKTLITLIACGPEATLIRNKDGKLPYQLISPKDFPMHFKLVTLTTALFAIMPPNKNAELAIEAMNALCNNGFKESINRTQGENILKFMNHFNLGKK